MEDPILGPRDILCFVVVDMASVGQGNNDLSAVVVDIAVVVVVVTLWVLLLSVLVRRYRPNGFVLYYIRFCSQFSSCQRPCVLCGTPFHIPCWEFGS